MPKKSKGKFANNRGSRPVNKVDGAEIFRNEAALYDDTEPRESLQRFMEMFHGKIDDNVISMIYTECFPNVDQCLESLLNLSCEVNTQQADENTNIVGNDSKEVDTPIDTTLSQSWPDKNIPSISENSEIKTAENIDWKQNQNERYNAQAYDCYQIPSDMNYIESDSTLSASLPNSFQYSGFFTPMHNNQMYPPLGNQFNYYDNIPQLNASNYELKSYASQIKSDCSSPKSNPRTRLPSNSISSPKNGRNGFKWNNTDEVNDVIERIKMGQQLLIVLRGLPGSGKSTLAKKLKFSGVVFTTDDFFYKQGRYVFDPSFLSAAHYWNQNRSREALLNKETPVIIDNTNTEAWEMLPYIKMGRKFNYKIVILEPNTPWKFKPKELAFRNKHGVPKEKITNMLARYQHNITLDNFDATLSTTGIKDTSDSSKLPSEYCDSISNEAENGKPSVSLKAVVHHEKQPADISEENKTNVLSPTITFIPKNFTPKKLLLPANKSYPLMINECGDTEPIVESVNLINDDIKIDNLEELKSLACEDSEDSQSLDKNDAQTSDQELTSWEEITEHDDDFLWKTSSSHDVSSSFHSSTLLVNEDLNTTNEPEESEEKQVFCHENSTQSTESKIALCLPAPDVISIGEPKSMRNSLHSFVDVLPEIEEHTLAVSNSNETDIPIDSDVKDSKCVNQKTYSHNIHVDEPIKKELNSDKVEKNPCSNKNVDSGKKEFTNLQNSELKQSSTLKIISKLNDLNTFTSPSNHQLSKHKATKSFDESYALQETKTKYEKGSETNLLRSKFFSVPTLGNQFNILSENFNSDLAKITKHNSYNEKLFIETDIEIEKDQSSSDLASHESPISANSCTKRKSSLKSISCNEKLFIKNELEISEECSSSDMALQINDLKKPESWEKSENHFIGEGSMTELPDYSIIKSPFDESTNVIQDKPMEKESNHVPDFANPKPQRDKKLVNMIFGNKINEKKVSESVSSGPENFHTIEQFGKWDYATEPEAKMENFEDNVDTNNVLLTPKPPRNTLQTPHTSNDLKSSKKDVNPNSSNEYNKSGKYKNKQRSPLLKQADQYMSKDWVFPQFIQNQVHVDSTLDVKISASYENSDTQTELKDFIFINKMEENEPCASEYNIIAPSKNNQWHKNFNLKNSYEDSVEYFPRIPRLEKSTSTEGLEPNIEISEKLARLNECFPNISNEDLNHLMGLCNNDETWVTNLLLDSEYNPCVKKESDGTEHHKFGENDNNSTVPTILDGNIKMSGFKIFSKSAENGTLPSSENSTSNSTTESDSASDEGQVENILEPCSKSSHSNSLQTLHLSLQPVFAMQLEELFGPVATNDSASSEPSHPIVEIDLEFAKLIHSKWKDSVQKKGQTNCENVDVKSKKTGVKLSGKKNKKDQKSFNAVKRNGEPMSLSEIMEMEQAVEERKKEKLKKDRDIVTKKNRNKLYNMFPGADPTALDEIFESNNCCFESAVKALEEDLHNSKTTGYGNLTLKECEGYAEILSESKDSWIKSNSTSGYASNDLNDWVCSGENDYSENTPKSTKEATSPYLSTITPEAEALRGKAVEYYLLQQQSIQKASKYYQSGMKPVASFYAQDASEHKRKFKEANKAASELIAEQRNAPLGYFTLDLHGLYVQEAIPKLEKFLRERKLEIKRRPQGALTKLSIITGQGLHSIRGPKLRPSVIEYLRRSGYYYSESNVGVLEVYLNSDGSASPRYPPKDVCYDIE